MRNKFSIVIPYHAVAATIDFVKRQLNYYHSDPTPMTVILAVSGDEIVKVELEQFIKKLNDPRFIIFVTDESDITNFQSFVKKIYNALQMVATPYVIINGADDVVMLEAAHKGIEILANNPDVAATKGYTVGFRPESGEFLFFNDPEIVCDRPIDRIKLAIKDRDSIFYIIRRTKDLVGEFKNILTLSEKSNILRDSPFHVEHFMALSLAACGKMHVFKSPWRLFNIHKNNHSSYIEAHFLRFKFVALDKGSYEWFKSVTKNMSDLSYNYYKFLWVCNQIRGINIPLKGIIYQYLKKNCSLTASIRIFAYFVLHKIFILFKKCFCREAPVLKKYNYKDEEYFLKTEQFGLLKKHYFSENDLKLIESKEAIT